MKWNICPNREAAQANVAQINRNLIAQGVISETESFCSIFQVGHRHMSEDENFDHPNWYHVWPTKDVMDQYFPNCCESMALKDVIEYDLSDTDPSLVTTYPSIWDCCLPSLRGREPKELNYRFQLADGKYLHQVTQITDDGHLATAEYFTYDVDTDTLGDLSIKIEETYTTDPAQALMDPCAREVTRRTKTWTYYNLDGTIYATYTKPKIYDTREKKAKEGEKRRKNLIHALTTNVATGGLLSGQFGGSQNTAFNELTALLSAYSGDFTVYKETGRGDIFDKVQNDTGFAWLNTTVIDSPQTQAKCPQMIGMTLRAYTIDKLKGKIK